MSELSTKKRVIESIDKLPDDASYDDILERIELTRKIEIGLAQSDAGEGIDHEDIKKMVEEW